MLQRTIASILVGAVLLSHVSVLAWTRAADQFQKVKLLINTSEKPVEIDVILRLEEDRLVVRSKAGAAEIKLFPYSAIRAAEYSYSKSPRWKSGVAAAVAVGVFALFVFFMKCKNHLETAARRAATAVAARRGLVYSEDSWGRALQLLRAAGVIEPDEEQMLARVYTFISAGAHVPKGLTDEEWARLARTFGVSSVYFVVRKYLAAR